MSGVIQKGLAPRNKFTWRSKVLEAGRPGKKKNGNSSGRK